LSRANKRGKGSIFRDFVRASFMDGLLFLFAIAYIDNYKNSQAQQRFREQT